MSQLAKKGLSESLLKLLSKKTLDKITVKDIVEDCGVNRQTFYYHFQDIYDLMSYTFLEEAQKVIADKKTNDTWQEGYLKSFAYARENRTLVLNAYHSLGREHLESYLYQITQRLLLDVLEENLEGLCVEESDREFIVDFYKYAFVGFALDWIRNGMKEDPLDLVNRLSKLISGEFRRGLERFTN